MKHLRAFKLFESNSNLWELITHEEWSDRESIWGQDIPIDQRDKQAIESIRVMSRGADNWTHCDFNLRPWPHTFSDKGIEIVISVPDKFVQPIDDKKLILVIVKNGDDWFLVKESFNIRRKSSSTSFIPYAYRNVYGDLVYTSHYRCDQIGGLLELIKNRRNWLQEL